MHLPNCRIVVALSGGVDSAGAAWRLRQAGAEVAAAYIRTWAHEADVFAECPAEQDIADARAVAETLGIPFEVVNLIDAYRQRIVDYLIEGYRSGVTPNPDVMCNREIKFGIFLDWARSQGFGAVATGHYARRAGTSGQPEIWEGVDKNKDQSYFLALMRSEQAAAAVFPVGDLPKPRVRDLAKEANLPVAQKKDSQGICFLGKVDINRFLASYIEDAPGSIVTVDGEVRGEHRGLHRYTLGQRKGIGIPSNTDNEAFVVVEKRLSDNALVIAFDDPETPGLWQQRMAVAGLSWLGQPPTTACELLAKPRYRDPSVAIRFTPASSSAATIEFAQPQRALASGQVVAFYEGERLLGGGFYQ